MGKTLIAALRRIAELEAEVSRLRKELRAANKGAERASKINTMQAHDLVRLRPLVEEVKRLRVERDKARVCAKSLVMLHRTELCGDTPEWLLPENPPHIEEFDSDVKKQLQEEE